MNVCILYVYCRKGTKTLFTVIVLADLPEYTMHCILEILQRVQNVGRRRRVGLQDFTVIQMNYEQCWSY